jgi:CheY-like chemotaxis protein
MNVLIVEDNARMRGMIRTVVGDLADEIFECEDGDEALLLYEKYKPDWVLMDIRMKRTDGLTATRQIKSAFTDAKIIVVTNYNDTNLQDAAINAGAIGYVLKENLPEIRGILLQ